MSDPQNRTAIVTGGANGIGKAIVERLCQEGLNVIVADLHMEAAIRVAGAVEAKGSATALNFDVTSRVSVERMVEGALERLGHIDVLVNNAGIMDRQPFLEMEEEFWAHVLNLNLGGAFRCSQIVARHMVARGQGGRIVNVASNSGLFGGRGRAAYGSSKAGMINLTQTMAIELAEHNIIVNAVAPGLIKTREDQPATLGPSVANRMPLKRYGTAEEVAEAEAFLASPACSFTTGHVVGVDGGFTTAGVMEA